MEVTNQANKLSKKQRYELLNITKRQLLQDEIDKILLKLKSLIEQQVIISEKIEYMTKRWPHEVKQVKKDTQIRTDNLMKSGVRYKAGFAKSVKLSENLTTFLKVSNDTTMSVSEIVNSITQYIRSHKLQDPSNRKAFNPDENLQNLFKQSEKKITNNYTYYGIHKYIKPHLNCT